jgi:hypothetical protein
VKRMGYSLPGHESVFPLDAELNLPLDKYSHGLRRLAAEESAKTSFDEVVAMLQKLTGGRIPKRQYMQVDPENRLVASELEKRWDVALRELKQAEDSLAQRKLAPAIPLKITAELKEAFTQLGRKLPDIWDTGTLSREHKKALIRCLIDKVIIHRMHRDLIHTRIVWKGGATSSFDIPIAVGSFAELPFRYDTWQLGTYIHDPDDWNDTHAATFEEDHGIHHYYQPVDH